MKRLLIAIGCLMVMTGPSAEANGIGFDWIYLSNFFAGTSWNTYPPALGQGYNLGVSADPGGSLIPLSVGKLNPLLGVGNVYYLYAGNLSTNNFSPGATAVVNIYTDYIGQGGGSPRLYANFTVVGSPGTFQLWNNTEYGAYNPDPPPINPILTPTPIYLGWAQGTADKVDLNSFSPGGGDDIYLVLGIGVEPTAPVPIPGAVWLLGSGVIGLIGLKRRSGRKT